MEGEKKEINGFLARGAKLAGTPVPLIPLVLILFFATIVGVLIILKECPQSGKNAAVSPDVHFKNCTLLEKDCVDVATCGLNVHCGDGKLKDCWVYDCGNSYGVYTKDASDNDNFFNDPKADEKKNDAVRDACSGTIETLDQECKGNKTVTKIKISTKGECAIDNFAVIYENVGTQANTFTAAGDNTYEITSDSCGKIMDIVPATKEGIGLNLKKVGA